MWVIRCSWSTRRMSGPRRLGDAHELGNLAGEKGTTSKRSILTGPAPPARVLVFTGVEGEHAAWATRVPNPTRQ